MGITHAHRLGEGSHDLWKRFLDRSEMKNRARITIEPRDTGWLGYAGVLRDGHDSSFCGLL